jgi:RNA polymerase sigma-70 factor (ECF subfamily)
LYAIDGFTHKEIAQQMSMSEGTSRWHVSEARKQLQRKINRPEETLKTQSKLWKI